MKHQTLEKIWSVSPEEDETGDADVNDFDLRRRLRGDLNSYRYTGSWTTPPCTESVARNLFATPIRMSQQQIVDFAAVFYGPGFPNGNARPTQPLGDREIRTDVARPVPTLSQGGIVAFVSAPLVGLMLSGRRRVTNPD